MAKAWFLLYRLNVMVWSAVTRPEPYQTSMGWCQKINSGQLLESPRCVAKNKEYMILDDFQVSRFGEINATLIFFSFRTYFETCLLLLVTPIILHNFERTPVFSHSVHVNDVQWVRFSLMFNKIKCYINVMSRSCHNFNSYHCVSINFNYKSFYK